MCELCSFFQEIQLFSAYSDVTLDQHIPFGYTALIRWMQTISSCWAVTEVQNYEFQTIYIVQYVAPGPDEKDANVYFLPQKNSSELKFVLQFTVTFP